MSSLRARKPPAGFIEPCQPSSAPKPPSGSNWIHEIKHDGYRMMVRKDPGGIRILTRNGHDWTPRFPLIVSAANAIKAKSFLIDGEAVVCRPDGVTDFNRLRSGSRVKTDAFLYAFDLLSIDGRDLRREPIEKRKASLARLLRAHHDGIRFCDHLPGDGELIFAHACALGFEGIVSKRLGSRYTSGRTREWIKVKNPEAPAVRREREEDWSRK